MCLLSQTNHFENAHPETKIASALQNCSTSSRIFENKITQQTHISNSMG
jgi:hypothetical protein